MRVRVLKTFWYRAQNVRLKPGDIIDIPGADARAWMRHDMAMLDKTVDVPENKAEPVIEVKPKPKPKRKTRK